VIETGRRLAGQEYPLMFQIETSLPREHDLDEKDFLLEKYSGNQDRDYIIHKSSGGVWGAPEAS
jgi:hypothetical protein